MCRAERSRKTKKGRDSSFRFLETQLGFWGSTKAEAFYFTIFFIDEWYCPHVPIREKKKGSSFKLSFAFNRLQVMFKREFTALGWLVLFFLKVTIIKRSHFIVSANVFLSAVLHALKNNLQYKHKSTHLTLITFNQDRKSLHVYLDDVKSTPNGNCMLSLFMSPLIICVQFRTCLQSVKQDAIYGNCWPITTWQAGKSKVPVFTLLTWELSEAAEKGQC